MSALRPIWVENAHMRSFSVHIQYIHLHYFESYAGNDITPQLQQVGKTKMDAFRKTFVVLGFARARLAIGSNTS